LWELATAGLASADGFDQLRAMMDPRRKTAAQPVSSRRPVRSTAGRWSLLNEVVHSAPSAIEQAKRNQEALESYARMLLTRYGVVFRDLLARESNAPKWRELLGILRSLEARGEIRGGRFVTGFGGEQYALPEAADSLRASRSRESESLITVAGADPVNLAGIVLPGERVPSIPGRQVRYCNGRLFGEDSPEFEAVPNDTLNATIPPPQPALAIAPLF
jgi:ATP-dependent Lhr-like helicase